jgi:putative endonuclease
MFVVYVLFSKKFEKIYIGYTTNLDERLKSHNELGHKGWTIRYRPWELLYQEEFKTRSAALKRERELKSAKGREWIWEVIRKG